MPVCWKLDKVGANSGRAVLYFLIDQDAQGWFCKWYFVEFQWIVSTSRSLSLTSRNKNLRLGDACFLLYLSDVPGHVFELDDLACTYVIRGNVTILLLFRVLGPSVGVCIFLCLSKFLFFLCP